MPNGAFNICCQRDCVSEGFKGGTRGSPIMPRDAVSRTANVGTVGINGLQHYVRKYSIDLQRDGKRESNAFDSNIFVLIFIGNYY